MRKSSKLQHSKPVLIFVNICDDRGKGTRDHSLKLVKVRCTRDSRRHFFSNRVIKRWNQLNQEAVDATSINAFKSKLDRLKYTKKAKVKASHTRYRALGPELIPVYRQSACR